MLSLFIIVWGFYQVHSQCCTSANTHDTISCVSGSASVSTNPRYEYMIVPFSTDKTEDVTISTCDSGYDTVTNVYSTPTPSTPTWSPVSTPTCSDGDDCGVCSNSRREEFTISNLPAGDYVVRVDPYLPSSSPTCSCSPPTSSPLKVSISGCHTPSPTPNPTPSPTTPPTLNPTLNPTINPTSIPTTPPTTSTPTTKTPTTATPTTKTPTTASPTTTSPTTAYPTTASPSTVPPTTDHPTVPNPTPKPTPKPALVLHSPSRSPTENVAAVEDTVSATAKTGDAASNTAPRSRSNTLDYDWMGIYGGISMIIGMFCCVLIIYFWRKRIELIKRQNVIKHLGSLDLSNPPTVAMQRVASLSSTYALQNTSNLNDQREPQPNDLPPPPPPPLLPPAPQNQAMQQTQYQHALWMQQQQQQQQMGAMMMHVQQQVRQQQQQVQQGQLLGGLPKEQSGVETAGGVSKQGMNDDGNVVPMDDLVDVVGSVGDDLPELPEWHD